jgi:2-polyprenyl-3-methyl-5-hydroxy-6-metoxy-1,4-benzoquinol methylase
VSSLAADTVRGHRWNSAEDYESHTRRLQRRNCRLLVGSHPDPASARAVFEIGCGTGHLTSMIASSLAHARITALDISTRMLEIARAKVPSDRVSFECGDFVDALVTGTYDTVFSNAALHWMYPRYPELFAKIRSMLEPGGFLCAASAGRTCAADAFDAQIGEALLGLSSSHGGDFDFGRTRLKEQDVHALAAGADLTVDETFLVERSVEMRNEFYARWWVASGGPWRSTEVSAEDAVDLITRRLNTRGRSLRVIHASVFMVLRNGRRKS